MHDTPSNPSDEPMEPVNVEELVNKIIWSLDGISAAINDLCDVIRERQSWAARS